MKSILRKDDNVQCERLSNALKYKKKIRLVWTGNISKVDIVIFLWIVAT